MAVGVANVSRAGRCFRHRARLVPGALWLAMALIVAPQVQAQGVGQRPSTVPLLTPPPSSRDLLDSRNDPQSTSQQGRDIEAASRRVQADGIDSEIRRREQQIESDRLRTDSQRAVSRDALESQRLRREFELRQQEYQRQRSELEKEKQRIAPPAQDDR